MRRKNGWWRAAGLIGLALGSWGGIAAAQSVSLQPLVHVAAGEQPIRLNSADVHVDVRGSFAHTVIEFAFTNPNARVLEGELQFPLRPGQTVAGFALEMTDGTMMPAVPVPKARGRQVFEQIVRRGADPALLEQTAGDNFRLRLYPLRPGVARHVRIELDESLASTSDGRLQLGLPVGFGSTPADRLALQLRLHGVAPGEVHLGAGLEGATLADDDGALLTLAREHATRIEGARSTGVDWRAPRSDAVAVERVEGQAWFHVEVPLADASAPRARPDDITLIWDASGSGAARDHGRELKLLAALFAWQPDAAVHLRLVRDAAEPVREFRVRGGDWAALRDALEHVAYDGASNAALWTTPAAGASHGLALLFSDGLGNWGPQATAPASSVPAFALQSAPGGNALALRQWADRRGGQLIDLEAGSADDALRLIATRGMRVLRVEADGADQVVLVAHRPEGGRLELAGHFTGATAQLVLVLEDGAGREQRKTLALAAPPLAQDDAIGFATRRWAALRVGELLAEPQLHRSEIRTLGERFGVLTPETSLIVLESLADYQQYGIVPPAGPMREAYLSAQRLQATHDKQAKTRHLEELVRRYADVAAWWDKDFPKDAPAPAKLKPMASGVLGAEGRMQAAASVAPPPNAPPPPMAAPVARAEMNLAADAKQRDEAPKLAKAAGPKPAATIGIAIQPWTGDSELARRLVRAADRDRYAVYLDERTRAAGSPAFYLDAAQVFVARGQRPLAVRVLSNLAELQLEDRGLLRILAYRLQDAGETAEAVRLIERVAQIAPDEPQSWRDLGLAQAAAGAWQPAIDALWTAASGSWDARFGDIDVIALAELDALAAQHPGLDLSAVDKRLRRNLPLDVRVAMGWDSDSVDIDLWVKDPNGEWVSYQQPLSRQGGRVTRDVTQGYGPEVFALKTAKPGHYEVRAKYFASHRQALGIATTVMMRLTTGFGTTHEAHRDVVLRLEEQKDDMLVGSFDVR
jgi:Ca-activated chloride channel family protein